MGDLPASLQRARAAATGRNGRRAESGTRSSGYYAPRNTRAPLPVSPGNQPPIPYERPFELPRFREPRQDWRDIWRQTEDATMAGLVDATQKLALPEHYGGGAPLLAEIGLEATGIPAAIRAGTDARQGNWGGAALNMSGAMLAGLGAVEGPVVHRAPGLLAREAPTEALTSVNRPPPRTLTRAGDGSILPERPREPFRQSFSGGSDDLMDAATRDATRGRSTPMAQTEVLAAGGDGLPPRPNTGGGGAETLPPGALREIDDFYASVKLPASGVHRLEDVLDHPALFREFPELRGVEVRIGDMGEFAGGRTEGRTINLEPRFIGEMWGTDAKSTLLHEVQHIIDKAEGRVVQGGTPDWITRNVARNGHLGPARDMYERLGTEQTAFATQRRANMTAAERAANDPFTSEPLGYRKVPWLRRMFGKEGKPYELYPLDRPRLAEITSDGLPPRPDAGGDWREHLRTQGFDVDRPLYHGTGAEFDNFDASRGGQNFGGRDSRLGVSLTSEPWNASDYALDTVHKGGAPNVRPVFARGRFKDVTERELAAVAGEEMPVAEAMARASEQARAEGFDGLAVHGVARGQPTIEYKVFPDADGGFSNIAPRYGRSPSPPDRGNAGAAIGAFGAGAAASDSDAKPDGAKRNLSFADFARAPEAFPQVNDASRRTELGRNPAPPQQHGSVTLPPSLQLRPDANQQPALMGPGGYAWAPPPEPAPMRVPFSVAAGLDRKPYGDDFAAWSNALNDSFAPPARDLPRAPQGYLPLLSREPSRARGGPTLDNGKPVNLPPLLVPMDQEGNYAPPGNMDDAQDWRNAQNVAAAQAQLARWKEQQRQHMSLGGLLASLTQRQKPNP